MAFPTSDLNLAYSALVLAIRNDTVLRKEFSKSMYTWTGEKVDPPSSGNTPYLCLKPRSAPNQDWQTNQDVGDDLLVEVKIVLSGNDITKMMDAWQAVARAVLPKDEAEYDARWIATSPPGSPKSS